MSLPPFIQGPEEAKAFQHLLDLKPRLVPFIGAGFSMPLCPGWEDFLKAYRAEAGSLLESKDKAFLTRHWKAAEPDFEKIADRLFTATKGREQERLLRRSFDKNPDSAMRHKQALLHAAFPGLKITTNFDRLIEDTADKNLDCHHGNRPADLHRALDTLSDRALLKIHGGLSDTRALILTKSQYRQHYGHPTRYDADQPLPALLKHIYTGHSLLFIGCSLAQDRTMMILEDLEAKRPHFALLTRIDNTQEHTRMLQRLSRLGIQAIWINTYSDIDLTLQYLAGPAPRAASPQLFVGRENELKTLLEGLTNEGAVHTITGRLFSLDGAGGVGKTTLARQARYLSQDGFPDGCFEFDMTHSTPSLFAKQLAQQLGSDLEEPADPERAHQSITHLLHQRRALILLDNLTDVQQARYLLPQHSPTCFLITTRNKELDDLLALHRQDLHGTAIHLKTFTPEEALALFQKRLGARYQADAEADYLALAQHLGYLPIALSLALNLMIFPPRWTAQRILDNELKHLDTQTADRDLRTLAAVFDLAVPYFPNEQAKGLLRLMAQCAEGPVPLDFLQRLWDGDPNEVEILAEELHSWSWCERIGAPQAYELHALTRQVLQDRETEPILAETFLAHVHHIYTDEEDPPHFSLKDRLLPQAEETVRRLAEAKDRRLRLWIGRAFCHFCDTRGYGEVYVRVVTQALDTFPEDKELKAPGYGNQALILMSWGKLDDAMALLLKQQALKEDLGDRAGLAKSYGNQALILNAWGKLDDAMALLLKQQALCEDLGDQAGLATCYGNQALILRAWGKLDEAMALHLKEQALWEDLGDRAGLAKSYGNQALILNAWGKLDDAMALHLKEQALCEDLGDRASLTRSWGNQALILRAWGKLDDAMALHLKEQALCEDLGDRAGLTRSYGNQAAILRAWGKLDEAMALLLKQQALCEDLGDRAGLARSWGNQALILSAWGKLDEAMALLLKQQALKEGLGDRAGLAICLWNQGCLLGDQGDIAGKANLCRQAIAINKDIGIPTEKLEHHLAALEAEHGPQEAPP